jgi:hypothetical protein
VVAEALQLYLQAEWRRVSAIRSAVALKGSMNAIRGISLA